MWLVFYKNNENDRIASSVYHSHLVIASSKNDAINIIAKQEYGKTKNYILYLDKLDAIEISAINDENSKISDSQQKSCTYQNSGCMEDDDEYWVRYKISIENAY